MSRSRQAGQTCVSSIAFWCRVQGCLHASEGFDSADQYDTTFSENTNDLLVQWRVMFTDLSSVKSKEMLTVNEEGSCSCWSSWINNWLHHGVIPSSPLYRFNLCYLPSSEYHLTYNWPSIAKRQRIIALYSSCLGVPVNSELRW